MRVLVFDTETTGLPQTKILNPDTLHLWPTIVQFSFIIYDLSLNEIILSNDHVIKIPNDISISEESSKIHGITNEICSSKGVLMEDVLDEFFCCLKNVDCIVGHNVSFDKSMIVVELLRIIYNKNYSYVVTKKYKNHLNDINTFRNVCCTLQDSVNVCNIQAIDKFGRPYLKYPKLIELHQKLFNTSPNNLHNSFSDILVTLRCFMKLKHEIDILYNCESFNKIASQIMI